MDERSRNERECSEERKLELRLGPPCCEDWSRSNKTEREESLLSLGYFSALPATPWSSSYHKVQVQGGGNNDNNNNIKGPSSFLHQFPTSSSTPVMSKDATQSCGPKVVDLRNGDNKVFSHPSSANTAVPNTSQKRTAPGPVVGWPPIRSFRKNLATSNTTTNSKSSPQPSKQPESHNNKVAGKKHVDDYGTNKGLFVKINMDGVPIGRKVDLNAYDSYQNLSSAVDDLFRGLLAAQRNSCGGGGGGVKKQQQQEEKAITGLLDGSGEYTLVYEDNEGDRMLVGDVPWHMFVSTVKRLRVLKSTELSAFTLGTKQDKIST